MRHEDVCACTMVSFLSRKFKNLSSLSGDAEGCIIITRFPAKTSVMCWLRALFLFISISGINVRGINASVQLSVSEEISPKSKIALPGAFPSLLPAPTEIKRQIGLKEKIISQTSKLGVNSAANLKPLQKRDGSTVDETVENHAQPFPPSKWTGKKILFVYAHIDDMEGCCAGLVSQISNISEVHLLILTNGDKGCGNAELCGNSSNAELAYIRQSEQFASAGVLGIPTKNVLFLDYEDCFLSNYPSQELQRHIVTTIRSIQPDVIFTWDPAPYLNLIPHEGWNDIGYHPDHQTSGQLTLDSVWLAQLQRAWSQLGLSWRVPELYFFAFTPTRTPDFFIDVTGEAFEKKTEAFLEMHSQYTESSEIVTFLDFVGSQVSALVGLPEGSRAEGYNYVLW